MLDYLKIRRDLHQIPEIGLEEYKTHAYLMQVIDGLTAGLDFVEIRTWRTGILVFIKGSSPDKTIGWRTDIDGLPIVEDTGLDFASTHEGRMHACGHDMHMTVALGLLEQAVSSQPMHNLLFLFQPAEENEAGGMLMYEDGAFGDWLPDEFYGLHVRPDLKVGDIATNRGTLFAGTCEVKLTFKGKGGMRLFLMKPTMLWLRLATLSPRCRPLSAAMSILSKGSCDLWFAPCWHNQQCHRRNGLSTWHHSDFDSGDEPLDPETLTGNSRGPSPKFRLELDLELKQGGYLPVENHPDLAGELMDFFQKEEGVQLIDIAPAMTGEDFGYLLSKVKGVMFWLGVDSPYALHHPKMTPDEAALPFAIEKIGKFLDYKINER
ncbi:M20/M25/M40 family metallo-hydrolase [Streptococcus sanguinis]|uniref:N-acetyldiaminopimelate deacetylase n=1 Tax=Streptococcus sanguinis TaxID=1305 RepID=A0A7H8UY22_STRSA|nr:M20/M25/M40 family metallo-hydrolase [Streptococcus sanguinis]QLB49269.1 N-acetyldiaminopimelate deacetylase [Streptococcus sanguinis]